jgi:hypothetical protein
MASSASRNREIDDALRKMAEEFGAGIRFEDNPRAHRRVVFTRSGHSRFNVLSNTPSSGGVLLAVCRQAKRTLRELTSISNSCTNPIPMASAHVHNATRCASRTKTPVLSDRVKGYRPERLHHVTR